MLASVLAFIAASPARVSLPTLTIACHSIPPCSLNRTQDLLAESLGNERQPRMPKMSIGMVARSQQQPQAGQDARQTQVRARGVCACKPAADLPVS